MKILTEKGSNVIVAISSIAEIAPNGIQLDDLIYGIPMDNNNVFIESYVPNIYDVVEVPVDVKSYQYCYDELNGFYSNVNYKPYISTEEEIEKIKAELYSTQKALDYLIMNGDI